MTKIKNTSATNPRQKTRKVATKKGKATAKKENSIKSVTDSSPIRYASVPLLQRFRDEHTNKRKKNGAAMWIPIECSLLIRHEFATLSPQTRYAFVAIMLFCGMRGIDVIPLDAKFLSSALVIDYRTLSKSLDELLENKLLLEREKDRKEKIEKNTQTDREKNRVCVSDFNFSQEEAEEKEKEVFNKRNSASPASSSNGHLSNFSMTECLKYVELCQSKGDLIANPRALATNLFRSGESDAFILGMLYPERVKELNLETFGNPIAFTDSPCSVCFGGKMSDLDGKGYSACKHCRNERGNATGYEPKEQTNEQK